MPFLTLPAQSVGDLKSHPDNFLCTYTLSASSKCCSKWSSTDQLRRDGGWGSGGWGFLAHVWSNAMPWSSSVHSLHRCRLTLWDPPALCFWTKGDMITCGLVAYWTTIRLFLQQQPVEQIQFHNIAWRLLSSQPPGCLALRWLLCYHIRSWNWAGNLGWWRESRTTNITPPATIQITG